MNQFERPKSGLQRPLVNVVHDLLDAADMSSRPEYYSGLGARIEDIDSKKLEIIYQGIEKTIGREAADQFALMVAQLPRLGATDFILNLCQLEANAWRLEKMSNDYHSGICTENSLGSC